MSTLNCALKRGRSPRLGGFEALERREMLSADVGIGHVPPAPHVAAHVGSPTFGVQQFEISIVGTEVSYSPAGLPTDMKGTIFLDTAAGTSAAAIGEYDETLTPIFAPLGPDGSLAFVGCNGVCTFSFDIAWSHGTGSMPVGKIVTNDAAFIEGALPDGTLLVGSHSSPITAATGVFQGMSGSFDGQSEVVMGATFSMHTIVDFTVTDRWGINMQQTLTTLAAINAGEANHQQPGPHDSWTHEHHPSHSHSLEDRFAAVDNIFADEAGTLFEHGGHRS